MLYDPLRRYLKNAICTDPADHKLFFAKTSSVRRRPSAKTQAAWDQAKEICNMCPVKMQCQRDTLGETEGVWGGRDPFQRWKIRTALHSAVKRWPQERRLRWGQELHRLRAGGRVFREIQRMTGVPEVPAMYLIREWERHLKAVSEQAPTQVVELPSPHAKLGSATPFPETPGRRHLWARNNGVVQDCWYLGQTEDGVWTYVNLDGRGKRYSSRKWIRTADTKIYSPQVVTIRTYVNRPDRPAGDRCTRGHLFDAENTYIRPDSGKRQCRKCKDAVRRKEVA